MEESELPSGVGNKWEGLDCTGSDVEVSREQLDKSLLMNAESSTSELETELETSAAGAGACSRESEMRSRILAKLEERCQGIVKNVKETRELSARILVEDIHGSALSGDSSDSDSSLSGVSSADQFTLEQEIRPESLLAELRSAQVYDAKRRLQVAQEEVKNQSPQLKALRAQLKAVEHQRQVELDEKEVELRKKDMVIEKLKKDVSRLQEENEQLKQIQNGE